MLYDVSVGGPDAADFTVTARGFIGGGVPTNIYMSPAENVLLDVVSHPSKLGAESATISFKSNVASDHAVTLNLSGAGLTPPVLGVTDDSGAPDDKSVALADTVVGNTSAAATFTLSNTGASPMHVSNFDVAGTDPSEFILTPQTPIVGGSFDIPAGSSTALSVQLSPTSHGPKSATISFNTDDPAHSAETLQISGTALSPATLLVTDTYGNYLDGIVAFYNVVVGTTTAAATYTLNNTGDVPLHVTSFAPGGANIDQFAVTPRDNAGVVINGTSFDIAPATADTVAVQFVPTSSGSKAATITFNTDDPAQAAVTLNMTGTAGPPAALTVSDNSGPHDDNAVNFAGTVVGGTSASATFNLSNSGIVSLHITSYTVTGADPSDFIITPSTPISGGNWIIYAYSNVTLTVNLQPSSPGAKSASITFNTDDPTHSAVTLQLNGTGLAPAALNVTDDSGAAADNSVTLANTLVGNTSAAATFTLSNTGDAPLHVSSFAVAGANADQFIVTPKDAAGTAISATSFDVPAHASYTVVVQLHPTSAGPKVAAVTFNTDDSAHANVTLNLGGTAPLPARLASVLLLGTHWTRMALASSTVNFGAAKLHKTGPIRTFRISNGGTAAMSLTQVAVSKGFKLLKTPPKTIAPGKYVTIQVQMLTSAKGKPSGTLRVKTNDPAHAVFNVRLIGTVK